MEKSKSEVEVVGCLTKYVGEVIKVKGMCKKEIEISNIKGHSINNALMTIEHLKNKVPGWEEDCKALRELIERVEVETDEKWITEILPFNCACLYGRNWK